MLNKQFKILKHKTYKNWCCLLTKLEHFEFPALFVFFVYRSIGNFPLFLTGTKEVREIQITLISKHHFLHFLCFSIN